MNRIPAKIRCNSDTMEDRLASATPPVRDLGLERCFTAIQEGPEIELLTLDPDDRLLHIRRSNQLDGGSAAVDAGTLRNAAKSDSGWQSETVKIPDTRVGERKWPRGAVEALRGFRQGGVSYALVHFPEKTVGAGADGVRSIRRYIEPMVYTPRAGWQPWKVEGEAGLSLLGSVQTEVFVDDHGRTILYGKPTGYSKEDETLALVFQDEGSGEWKTVLGVFPLEPGVETTYRLTANTDPDSLGTLLRLGKDAVVEYQPIGIRPPTERFPEPRLRYSRDHWESKDLSGLIEDVGALDAARFQDLPDQPGCFVVHSAANQHVYLITDLESATPEVTCLTEEPGFERAVSRVQVARDEGPLPGNAASPEAVRAAIFVIDASRERRLWIKRQPGTDSQGRPIFQPWVPLGSETRTLATPRRMASGAEMFVVNEQARYGGRLACNPVGGIAIEHKSFDPSGEAWHTERLETTRESLDEVESCITHTTELFLTTEDGLPAGNGMGELTASYPCVAVVNGVSRHLSPSEATRVYANEAGLIMVKIKADSVDAPVLRLQLAGDAAAEEIQPNDAIARRLAGLQKDHRIDQDRLHQAGLIPDSIHGTDEGKKLAALVRDTGKGIGRAHRGQVCRSNGAVWYHGRFERPDGANGPPVLRIRSGRGPLPEELLLGATPHQPPERWALGDPRDGLGLVGDIIHWIAQGIEDVVDWTVNIVGGIAKFAVRLAGKVWNFIVDTAPGLARGLEALFQAISRTLGQIIDAARTLLEVAAALFDIHAIRRTHDCMTYSINGGLWYAEQMVGRGLPALTHKAADQVLAHIDGQLETLERFTRGFTMGSLAGGFPDSPDGSSGFPGRSDAVQTGGVQARWVAERVMTHQDRFHAAVQNQVLSPADAKGLTEKILALAEELRTDDPAQDSLSKVVIDLAKDMQRDFQEGIQAVELFKVFTYIRRLVDLTGNLLVKVLDLLFELIAEALRLLRNFLNLPINIPGVSQLAHLVLKRSLTILDLFTFLFSVALTVFWKIITGGKEPFPETVRQQLLSSGFFPHQESLVAGPPVAIPRSDDACLPVETYLRVQVAKLFNQEPAAEDVEALTAFAGEVKGVVRILSPAATCFNLVRYFAIGTIGVLLAEATDVMDTAGYSAGSATVGVLSSLFTIAALGSTAVGVYISIVQGLTIDYLPDSPEGELWAKERTLVPPGDWPSFAWGLSLIFGVVGFICCSSVIGIPQPGGALGNAVFNVIVGTLIVIGTIVYTGFLIAKNQPRGWEIANQFGTMLGAVPSFFKWAPAVNSKLIKITPWGTLAAILLLGLLEWVNLIGTEVSCVTAIGNTIDQNMTQQWLDFGGDPA